MTETDSQPTPADSTFDGEAFAYRPYVPPGHIWNLLAGGTMTAADAMQFLSVAMRDDDGTPDVKPSRERFADLLFADDRHVYADELLDEAKRVAGFYSKRPTLRAVNSSPGT